MWKTDSPLIAILARLVSVVFVYRSFGVFVLFSTVVVATFGQTSVLTQHNDNARTGQNASETILNTSNVNTNKFGKLFAMPSDGQIYAQPLYVSGVTINGGVRNLVILATENDSVYAYDADSSGAPLWKASMVDAAHGAGTGETALNAATTSGCVDLQPRIGITSTPVIDPTSKTIYVEAESTDGTHYFHRLHALDLLTGNEKTPGPVVIAGTVSGTGDGSSNGQLAFDNLHQLNRPGLLLLNGTIYIAYASLCDFSPYHGWLFAYDKATFALKSVYVTTPNGGLGGFWMSGAGVAADASGSIFIASGNGDFDTTHVPARETSDTILKLGTTNQILTQLDYFTPQDQANRQSSDLDLGSGGVLILPDQPGPFPHILVQAGKAGRIYVVNRDQMTTGNSHYCSGCTNDPEIIEESGSATLGWIFNVGAYWNNTLYFWGANDVPKSIPISNGLPDFAGLTGSFPQIGFPGAGLSVSSNGTTPGSAIVWAIDGTQYGAPGPGPGPAVLYAYDATNVPTMLYSSAQNATRDAAGNAVKFAVPTIANGKVYIGTSTAVDVYGLVGNNPLPNISSITPSSAMAGGPAFPLTVNGTGFISGAILNFGSNPAITPSSVTSTQIVATIPAADIAAAGTVNVTVTNPAPGGTSNAQTFTINNNNPAPTETSISPTSATAGGAAFTLTVNGTGFVSTSVVKFNGAAKTTTFVSATQLTAAITAADIATAGTASVTVTNPAPGGGTSGTLSFTINGSALTLTSIAPASTTVGGTALTLTITGNGFVSGATVNFGANPAITPSSVTSTQIVATIPAADIAAAGTVNVTVTNPAPGGTSNAQTFTINNPAPTETSISPMSATAGGAAFTLTVNGTGFVSTSVVKFNGAGKTTTFVSATQLTAAITAADIATAGTASVTVTNPAPGGGTSGTLSFTINGSALTLTSMAPASTIVGGVAFTLTLTGTGFASGATVNFGVNPAITPSSVTSTQIVATIPATDIAAAGTVNVTVTNPAPGGTSNAQTFAINNNNPAPTETSISPTSATAGGAAFTLTVNGTGFVSTSVVKFNGAGKTTTFVSATQLTAAITAADIATAGTASVTVTNPAPGGGTSGTLSFTINGSALTLTSMAPASTIVGGVAFTLTLTGTGFASGATVNFGVNPAITPSSVTSTQIVATIPAADIAAAGTVNVTVTNPAPGGTSNAQTFTINNNNPAPTETSISPTSATAGGAAFTLTVNGTGFVSTSVVKFNGAAKTTTFVSATQLTAAITAADIATAGTASVTVTNPAPGGGTSGTLSFTINGSALTLTSMAPASTTVGGTALTLTITGNGFVSGATVNFGANPAITPSSVTSTQIVVTIPATDIAAAGTVNVTVTNPAPGGTSNAQTFTINNNNPAPTETSISPMSATAGGAAFTLTVNGTGFVSTSVVKFNGAGKTTTFVGATQLTAAITAADIATAGTASVTVTNPAPGGGTSGTLSFTINGSALTLTSMAPASTIVGGVAFTLTLTGTGFASGATVNFGSNPAITPSSVTSTQIVATIPAADIAAAGTVNVTVTNPAPGGTSNAQTFTINNNNPAPTETSISPTSATAGGAAFTLTVNGTGFVSTSVVKFNGAGKTTTFVSATQLTAAITAADIATAGTASVTVTNPAPGGGTSGTLSFTINGSALTLTSIAPASTTVGGTALTLTITGNSFVTGATVNFGSNPAITPSSVTSTQIVATIPAADIAAAGTVNVTVTNPAPGGTSNAQTFTINNPAPTVSSLSPSTAVAGSAAFALTVNGAGFVNGASVQFNGSSRATTFASTTQVTAAILASDVASAGTANVTVTNPAPTVGPSAPQVFTISSPNNPVPTISNLGATHAPGGAAFSLTVNGTNFEATSVVNFNGKPETTTFVSASRLSAAIPASDVAIVGNMNVTVTNPAPGGGTSTSFLFIVDGYTISGPPGASLSPGQPAMIQITATPTANGFPNPISFSVSGLPAGSTASFNPTMLTPNGNATTTTLTITDGGSAVSQRSASIDLPGIHLRQPLLAIWIVALLAWPFLRLQARAIRAAMRYAALALFALILLTGSILSGCALGVTSSPSTSTSQLTVTATSGALTKTFGVTLNVTR